MLLDNVSSQEQHPVAAAAAALLKCVQKLTLHFSHGGEKKSSLCCYAPSTSVTQCQKQNSLRSIKIQIGCTEAWVTSGGLFSNCMLAAVALGCFLRVVVLINMGGKK